MQAYTDMSDLVYNAVTAFKKLIINNYKCKLAISGSCVPDPCLGCCSAFN